MYSEIFTAMNKSAIYIYDDLGVSREALSQSIGLFEQTVNGHMQIKTLNALSIKQNKWTKDAALLVIPGGIASSYAQKLKGIGNQNILQYIEKGGAYLGICAGGYYGSAAIEFDKGGPLEVLSQRELQLFKGKAIGPILAPYDYRSYRGARAANLNTSFSSFHNPCVFYNGGGYFENAAACPNTQVIASYQNGLPAVIKTPYGKGNVLLSGVHFEYDPYTLDSTDPYLKQILPDLLAGDRARINFAHHVLQMLGLDVPLLDIRSIQQLDR